MCRLTLVGAMIILPHAIFVTPATLGAVALTASVCVVSTTGDTSWSTQKSANHHHIQWLEPLLPLVVALRPNRTAGTGVGLAGVASRSIVVCGVMNNETWKLNKCAPTDNPPITPHNEPV